MSDNKKRKDEGLSNDNYRDEMDELVRIFKEELDKAQSEAEDDEDEAVEESIEVHGYDPKAVTLDESRKKVVDYENLCDCCGERPRGTKKNPNSIFCEECESILEKYPYDWKGLITFVIILGIMIFGVINFAVDTPAFSHTKNGDKNMKANKVYSAATEYEKAEICIDENVRDSYKNLYKKKIIASYEACDLDAVYQDLTHFKDTTLRLPMFAELLAINCEIDGMNATIEMIGRHLQEFGSVKTDYDKIIAKLDSLSGKKIYEKNGEYHDELDTEFAPDGTETVYTFDESWLNVYKYAAAVEAEKEEAVLIGHLEKAMGYTEYIDRTWKVVLGSAYVSVGKYAEAEKVGNEIKAVNTESIDDDLIMSMIYRYRDKNYQRAIDTCVEGLNSLSRLEASYVLVAEKGHTLSMQKTLNFVMLKDYTNAYESAEECCQFQMDVLGTTNIQSRDMLAILALATGNTETYEELENEIKEAGSYGVGFSSDVTDYKDGKITLEEIVMSGRYDVV